MAILSTDFADCFGFNPASFVNRKTADLGLSPASDYYCEQVTPSAGRALFNLRPNSDYVQPVASSPLDAAQVREVRDATSVVDSGVQAPASNPSAAVGAAGVLTGAYYYTALYELEDGTLTEPWPGTATVVNPSAQRVNLSNIPVSASPRVAARRIYRTVAGPVDPKDYRYLTRIADNTTTTYVDNTADGSLGDPISWTGTANGVALGADGSAVIQGLGSSDAAQALAMGWGSRAGYASVSYGFESQTAVTTGRRNSSFGVYTLRSLTIGYENTAGGVHALDSLTTGTSCSAWGVSAGASNVTGNFLTASGAGALQNATVGGGTALGYRAGYGWTTGANGIAIGRQSNLYSNVASEFWLDCMDRTNLAGQQAGSLMWGVMSATVANQRLTFNALVKHFTTTVATLPAATGLAGFRAFVTDANATTFASVVAGGGANGVPVYCDGTNWRIG